ncbi:hypothetical protein [Chondromyces crocatus]|uniref:MalT-like TPR region domain-containing protein n=1 Tax=Chondromyces crocatus TaxID=52 RepID=A0A0K1EL64_CHOCO|nr:hypothetical protein [Chondromyces crocatus]AKT41610.1 uncharacterized protein CMC5_058170 [Chondromyces crocatus]
MTREDIEAELALARARARERPEDLEAEKALLLQLDRLAAHELDRGALERALNAAEEHLARTRAHHETHPTGAASKSTVLSLLRVGDVHMARGDLDQALAAYGESFGLASDAYGPSTPFSSPCDAATERSAPSRKLAPVQR